MIYVLGQVAFVVLMFIGGLKLTAYLKKRFGKIDPE